MKNFFLISALAFIINCHSQNDYLYNLSNSFIQTKVVETDQVGFITLKCDSLFSGQLFTIYKNHSGLGNNDLMDLIEVVDDSFVGLSHFKYQQKHKGIKIENAFFKEHCLNNSVIYLNGKVIENLNLQSIPLVNEENALTGLLSFIGAEKYSWEDDSLEAWLKLDIEDSLATYFPKGELIYTKIIDSLGFVPNNLVLSWKFDIWAINPNSSYTYYINALNGNLIKIKENHWGGNLTSFYYGNQYLDTRWYGGARSKHFLEANDDGRNIRTKPRWTTQVSNNFNLSELPDDKDDNWDNLKSSANTHKYNRAINAHYTVQEAWRMFKEKYGRSGMDNNNIRINVLADENLLDPNSNFKRTFFTRSNGQNPLIQVTNDINAFSSCLDVIGHEFTHGVIDFTCKLDKGEKKGETGAIAEGYCDIFGFLTERNSITNWNWLLGDISFFGQHIDMTWPPNVSFVPGTISGCFRPGTFPTIYKGPSFMIQSTTQPRCIDAVIHHNRTVIDYYFYLLSIGGTQLNKVVNGVGVDKAALINYYSMTNFMLSNEDFQMARIHAVKAAEVLYGPCSYEKYQTCRAWSAVGVGFYCEPCNPHLISEVCSINRINNPVENFTSINTNNLNNEILIFPNPAADFLNIKSKNDLIGVEYKIIGYIGNEICNGIFDKTNQISISHLHSGIYFIKINLNNEIKFIKFVKN